MLTDKQLPDLQMAGGAAPQAGPITTLIWTE